MNDVTDSIYAHEYILHVQKQEQYALDRYVFLRGECRVRTRKTVCIVNSFIPSNTIFSVTNRYRCFARYYCVYPIDDLYIYHIAVDIMFIVYIVRVLFIWIGIFKSRTFFV